VTGNALRAAHGQVRCGRCHCRFDAIEQLLETETRVAAPDGASLPASEDPQPPARPDLDEPHSLTDFDIARIFVDEREWNTRPGATAVERERSSAEIPAILVEEPRDLEEITLEGRTIEISGSFRAIDALEDDEADEGDGPLEFWIEGASLEFVDGEPDDEELIAAVPTPEIPLPDDFARPEGFALRLDASEVPAGPLIESPLLAATQTALSAAEIRRAVEPLNAFDAFAPAPPVARPTSITTTDPVTAEIDAELGEIGADGTEREPRTLRYTLACLFLALLLFVQLVHHNRQDLARHPRFGSSVSALYAALGAPLAPNWDPTGYELQQWGIAAASGEPSTLQLTASIRNRAGFAQPYPLVRLSLEDLWGSVVGTRVLEPDEYLPASTRADRLMAPGQRTDAEVRIVDPGEDAVGFRVDACVRVAGNLCCADAADPVR
jgi:hypothetical protein